MIVCAHGEVSDFCKLHDMVIVERHTGEIESYTGPCKVLVTDQDLTEYEYYFLKGRMFANGVELVSTKHVDSKCLFGDEGYKTGRNGGRQKFGFYRNGDEVKLTDNGRRVVTRILELRDAGYTYQKINEDGEVRHPDGRKLGISTIQVILKNRKDYEKEGL